jgi:DNA (cytosine-5)-methyltransferase 1
MRLGNAVGQGLEERIGDSGILGGASRAGPGKAIERAGIHPGAGSASPVNGKWADADWLFCRDGKWRPVEPGTFPLAHGAPSRVGRLRAYGNAINAEAATQFILACLA